MHRYAALLLLAALASRASAYAPVTAAQLSQLLAAAHGRSDAEMARQLADLQLTERLSASRFSQLQSEVLGDASRQALLAIGDASTFLSMPSEEIPSTAAPDLATQRRMMASTVDYVTRTIHLLPNLYTTRVTSSFEDDPWRSEKGQSKPGTQQAHPAIVSLRPFHFVGTDRATVLYRKGEEEVKAEANQSHSSAQGLTTSGEFGPILGTAMLDAARSKLGWSHWERTASGPIAVYRYAVPADKSHYQVKYCCIVRDAGDRIYFEQFVAYQGEIAVDPLSGAILRITLQAELAATDPLVRADIAVEYGPVDIGGKTYICPVKGVALSVGLALHASRQGAEEALRPLQTSLNDIAFNRYHAFRAEARVVSADKDDAPDPPPSPKAESVIPAQEEIIPSSALVDEPTAAAENVQPAAVTARTAAPDPVAGLEAAEIISGYGVAPDLTSPNLAVPSAQGENYTLRVTTRLVEVVVVALDNKGHPVTDLRVEDFEIIAPDTSMHACLPRAPSACVKPSGSRLMPMMSPSRQTR